MSPSPLTVTLVFPPSTIAQFIGIVCAAVILGCVTGTVHGLLTALFERWWKS